MTEPHPDTPPAAARPARPETPEAKLDHSLDETFPASDPVPRGPRAPAPPSPAARLLPGARAPQLVFPLLRGETWSLEAQAPARFSLLVAYRGRHCSVCERYLKTLEELTPSLLELGVEPVAFSMDPLERARAARDNWGLGAFPLGYALDEGSARRWGLYVSQAVQDGEPARFSEPGLFLVAPDRTLFYASMQSMPFGRPDLARLRDSLERVIDEAQIARGRVPA